MAARLRQRLGIGPGATRPDEVTLPRVDGCQPRRLRPELVENGTLHEQSVPVDSLQDAQDLAVLSSLRGLRRAELRRVAGSG